MKDSHLEGVLARGATPDSAVLLLAYGGPDSLDDVPGFLRNVRGGRPTPEALIGEVAGRYRQIGGQSPQLDILSRIAAGLAVAVGRPVYLGMRHWRPSIADAVARIAADGVRHLVTICMAPHYSELSIGAYRVALDAALADTVHATGRTLMVDFVESWHAQPDYVAGVVDCIQEALACFDPELRGGVTVVFTAHSLPAAQSPKSRSYDRQLRETARLVANRLAPSSNRWLLSYQSAPKTDAVWLGPAVEETVVDLADRGEKQLVIAPIGFVTDHVETLYDLDIGLQAVAEAHGIRMVRAGALNDSPALIAALADLVRRTVGTSLLTDRIALWPSSLSG